MIIDIQNNHDVFIVSPHGSLDVSVQQKFKDQVTQLCDAGSFDLVINFKDVSFIDSSCLGALVALTKRVREKKGDIKLALLSEDVRSIFMITRLDKVFDSYDDVETAVGSFFKTV